MRLLDCGCELSPGGKLMSICAIHGEHMHAVQEMQKHPRSEGVDREFQKKLTLELAPLFVVRAISATPRIDPDTTAESLFQHVEQILRRLD